MNSTRDEWVVIAACSVMAAVLVYLASCWTAQAAPYTLTLTLSQGRERPVVIERVTGRAPGAGIPAARRSSLPRARALDPTK